MEESRLQQLLSDPTSPAGKQFRENCARNVSEGYFSRLFNDIDLGDYLDEVGLGAAELSEELAKNYSLDTGRAVLKKIWDALGPELFDGDQIKPWFKELVFQNASSWHHGNVATLDDERRDLKQQLERAEEEAKKDTKIIFFYFDAIPTEIFF